MKRELALLALLTAMNLSASSAGKEPARQARGAAMPAASPGKQVFDRWCVQCHGDGPRYPGTASLAAKYGRDLPAALEKRKDLTPEAVALFVRNGISVMPPFRKKEITDAQLASLGAYLARERETGPASPNARKSRKGSQ